jgi:hypothetical protein
MQMSINDLREKIKWQKKFFVDRASVYFGANKIPEVLFLLIFFFLVATLAFSLGRLSNYEKKKSPISVIKTEEYYRWNNEDLPIDRISESSIKQISKGDTGKGSIVASKSGTKYYFPWCSGVIRIKEENKIWFNSVEEAQAKGLTPASGCNGLK